MPGTYTPDQPWRSWSLARWREERDLNARVLAADPGWKPGRGLLDLADYWIARLEEK